MVFDASLLFPAVVNPAGPAANMITKAPTVESPELFVTEVANTIRSNRIRGVLTSEQGYEAIRHLKRLPVVRHSIMPLLDRIWELQENLTAYDAAYVALAEALGEPLITVDGRMAKAPGIRCNVRVVNL